MTNGQDTNSTAQAGPGESKDGAQNQASQISKTPDALSDSSLDEVSGGSWPFSTSAAFSYSCTGGGG
ncbi:hypothetical protein [Bradyrhizobium sp. WSM1743]|uniref:hypothetical protein n=1 Tax=Bradyrhizobium sp. WSM1743 TaxID=318996 RepID=UPI0003F9C0D4|nr:hypothetical protein [Bradyrhizobium sp. WSM1743]